MTAVRPGNLDNGVIILINHAKIMKNVAKDVVIFDLTENMFLFSSVLADDLGASVSRPGDSENALRSA